MNILIDIVYFWAMLNCYTLILMAVSPKRLDYLIQFTVFFYGKNIFDFILKVIILFAYLPFNIASLIKEIINK